MLSRCLTGGHLVLVYISYVNTVTKAHLFTAVFCWLPTHPIQMVGVETIWELHTPTVISSWYHTFIDSFCCYLSQMYIVILCVHVSRLDWTEYVQEDECRLLFFSSPELQNIVTIHAAQSTMFAGSSYTLNCTVMSDLRSVVKWTGLDGNPVDNTSSIAVNAPVYNGNKTYLLLRFPALRTSQAGRYTCQSVVSSPLSVRTATKDVVVTGKT